MNIWIQSLASGFNLIPLSSDRSDYETLTPGQFLIAHPISSICEPNLTDFAN